MVGILLAEEHGTAGAAIRDVIESLAGVELAWDVHETQEALRLISRCIRTRPLFALPNECNNF